MTARVRQSFRDQAVSCRALGSPLMGRLLDGLAKAMQPGLPVADRVLGWPGDPGGKADALALRLAGGLHDLVLRGLDAPLAAAYRAGDDAALIAAALGAMGRHEGRLLAFLASAPQTNEVRRSVALIAAGQWLAARFGLPMVLSELGASAGLNLIWDRYALAAGGSVYGPEDAVLTLAPEWRGALPPVAVPQVVARAGVDLNPLDPEADLPRLLAYLWADQPDRIYRTRLAAAEAARLRPPLARGDAVDWLAGRLDAPMPGRLHLVFHTVAWQYFPADVQARGEALLQAAGARATDAAPLAHLSMEAGGAGDGAALTLRLWPGGQVLDLGRVDFHGRWVDWQADLP